MTSNTRTSTSRMTVSSSKLKTMNEHGREDSGIGMGEGSLMATTGGEGSNSKKRSGH